MKKEMTAFDVLALVNEAQVMVGGYVDKVFRWDKNVLLRVNIPGDGKRELLFQDGKWLYITPERPELPDFPDQFAVHLRKLISNAKITAIWQKDFDRVVVLELEKADEYRIVVELFGDGNLLLLERDRIADCLGSRRWRHREIRPGASYDFPPPRFNPLEADGSTFLAKLRESDSDLVRTLATSINLGGQYAEEVCLRGAVDKRRRAKALDEEEIRGLYRILDELLEETRARPRPGVVLEEESVIDATPIPLVQHEGLRREPCPTISEALSRFLSRRSEEGEGAKDQMLEKLERQLQHQEEAIRHLEREAEEASEKAEALYRNYQPVTSFLAKLAEIATGTSWEELRRLASEEKVIESIDPQTGTVKLLLDGMVIDLDYNASLEENASALYQRAKELRAKADRARKALEETERKIDKRRKGLIREVELEDIRPTKQFWFERYRWFITETGKLVLGGRDARTNDQLVKRHLKAEDRYVHADLHGAPSVIIKQGSEATEEELREACIFALCHSKAWSAGAAEGSAYWVLPDQVSKEPQAGEFVPRGAFIIRGKRNYSHHLPLRMAVGEIDYEGERKIMCSPVATMEKTSTSYLIIRPGRGRRGYLSSSLARAFRVPEDEISRILPPGDIDIEQSRGIEIPE